MSKKTPASSEGLAIQPGAATVSSRTDSLRRAPVQAVPAHRYDAQGMRAVEETVAAEVPVAMEYNSRPHVVMLATPADLEDFAFGFALTERIITAVSELTLVEQLWTEDGVALQMLLPPERFLGLQTRERNLTGRTGCGLCGAGNLASAIRPVRHVEARAARASPAAVHEGMARLTAHQPFNAATGAVHAAALLSTDGDFTVREDVGRHNAIDKAVGAVMRAGAIPHSLLVTSRASYEVVHKAAEAGCQLVAAISAPTALAVKLAQEAGVTLVGWTRAPRLTVYCGELA